MTEVDKNVNCRSCGSISLQRIHDFGEVPIADKLKTLKSDSIVSHKLSVSICKDCFLFQINEDLDPKILFQKNYPYYSSDIPEVSAHFKALYEDLTKRELIKADDFVLEIAGNDGVLLSHFLNESRKLLNIEPSIGPAKVSRDKGIPTINEFFSEELASHTVKKHGHPALILASNVLAHVPDPNSFVAGLSMFADDSTTIVLEVAHLLPMLDGVLFDMIFHQHFSYFSLTSIRALLNRHDLFVNSVELVSTQGGSLRLFVSKRKESDQKVSDLLEKELTSGLKKLETYFEFSSKIESKKVEIRQTLNKLKGSGNKVVGYGAPGKAATLLNYFEINDKDLAYLVDLSPSKQGFYFPFTGLKIYPVEKLFVDKPEVVLILAWNYKESIVNQLKDKLPGTTIFISIL